MGWRQPAEGLVFERHVVRKLRRRASPSCPTFRARSRPGPRDEPACGRTCGPFGGRREPARAPWPSPGRARPATAAPYVRPAIALEFGRRPLRREARLKEAINSGRGPQVGNVPGGQVILDGGEVLFPGFDARDAPSAFAFRNQQAEAPKPTDASQHGPSIVVRQRVGDSRGLSGTAERIQEKNRFRRDGESLSAAKFLDKELPLTPGNQEVGISDEPVQAARLLFLFRRFLGAERR